MDATATTKKRRRRDESGPAAAGGAAASSTRQKVLGDQDFVRQMTRIIRRDFFPDAPPIDSDDERDELSGKEQPRLDDFVQRHTSRRNAEFSRLQNGQARETRKRARERGANPDKPARFPLLGDQRLPQAQATARSAQNSRRCISIANTRLTEDDVDDTISEFSGLTEQTVLPGHVSKAPQHLHFGYAYLEDDEKLSGIMNTKQSSDSSSSSTPSAFAVPALPKRDELARQLASKAKSSRSASSSRAKRSSRQKSTRSKLSPAGLALANRLFSSNRK